MHSPFCLLELSKNSNWSATITPYCTCTNQKHCPPKEGIDSLNLEKAYRLIGEYLNAEKGEEYDPVVAIKNGDVGKRRYDLDKNHVPLNKVWQQNQVSLTPPH